MFFPYLTVWRGKSPLLLKWPLIGAELALFKGVICERAVISKAVLAPLNSSVAPVISKLTLHVVQFGPNNWVGLALKNWCQKQPHFNEGKFKFMSILSLYNLLTFSSL